MILAMEPMTNSRIKSVVLRRVRFMHRVRPFVSGTALALALVLVSVYSISREVWVARVIENMPSPANVAAFWRFVEIAFLNTSFAVQVLSVFLIAGTVWVTRDLARTIEQNLRYA